MTHPSRCLRLFAVSVLLAWTGCLSMPVMPTARAVEQEAEEPASRLNFMNYLASGLVGCPAQEVVIKWSAWAQGVGTFAAECRGHHFFCSYRNMDAVYCHEELVPIAPRPTTGPEGS